MIVEAEAEPLTNRLAALLEKSRPTLLARVDAIEKAGTGLTAGTLEDEERRNAERESHKLAGIAGTLGFPQVTTLALEAEALLQGAEPLDAEQCVRLGEIARLARAEFDAAPAGPRAPDAGVATEVAVRVALMDLVPRIGASLQVVVAAGIPDSLREELVDQVRALNGLLVCVETATDLVAVEREFVSPVLLIDADGMEGDAADVVRVVRADARGASIPIVAFIDANSPVAGELRAAGATEVIEKPVSVAEIISRIGPLVGKRNRPSAAAQQGRMKSERVSALVEEIDVAIVDDDELITAMIEDALVAAGYSFRMIRDGFAASAALVGIAAPVKAKVILLDLGLPGHDGFTVLRALQKTGVTKTSSVVVLTARSEQAEVIQSVQLGASGYVVKPFAIDDLMNRVRSALAVSG